jgi:hypothetical protein
MTFVSIKNTSRLDGISRTLEVRVQSNIWHAAQDFDQTAPTRPYQCGSQNFTMLRLSTTTVDARSLLEGFDDVLPDATNQQVRHECLAKSHG